MATNPNGPDATEDAPPPRLWLFPFFLALILGSLVIWDRAREHPALSKAPSLEWTPSDKPTGEVVQLEIDFGNGAKRQFDALPWKAGMTAADVMAAARDFQPGITYEQIGEGEGGFLTQLEGLKNEGASGRNWRYEVAGTPGTKSFCLQEVAPGEQVRWWFAGEDEGL